MAFEASIGDNSHCILEFHEVSHGILGEIAVFVSYVNSHHPPHYNVATSDSASTQCVRLKRPIMTLHTLVRQMLQSHASGLARPYC